MKNSKTFLSKLVLSLLLIGTVIACVFTRKSLSDNREANDRVRTDVGKLQDLGAELHNNNQRFEGLLSEIRENNKSEDNN